MDNKVIGFVSKASPQKCEGDSGELKSQVPLVTGRDGICYDAQKYKQQSDLDFIHGRTIYSPIGDQESSKNVNTNVTVQTDSDQKSFNK